MLINFMELHNWINKDLKRLKKINIILGLVTSLVLLCVITVALYLNWSFRIEDYCSKKAHDIVGDKWNILLDPTEEEKKFGLGKIAWGFREQLKCEKEEMGKR